MNKNFLHIAIILFFTLPVSLSFAQEAKEKIEVIEVTAQKRNQSINDIPMAINAFNAEQLRDMGIIDTTDLAEKIPGFNYSDTAFGPPVYTLRGVGFNESSAQASATVGIYLDEITIPFPIMTKGMNLDLERVEILKGPQGTLFGNNATAGAINYIAAKPRDTLDYGAAVSYGNFQTISVEGFATNAMNKYVNARLAIKVIKSNEGWQQSVSRDDTLGKQDKISARLSFDYEINNKTQALLQLGFARDWSDSLAPQAIEYLAAKAGGASNASYPIFEPILNNKTNPHLFSGNGSDIQAADWTADRNPAVNHSNTSIAFSLTHLLSDHFTLTSLTGINQFNDDGSQYERGGTAGVTAGFIRDLTGGPLDTLLNGSQANNYEGHLHAEYATIPDSEYVPSDYVFQHGIIDSFSQELRLTNVQDNVIWITGLYFSKSRVDYKTTQDWGLATNVNILPIAGFGFNKLRNVIDQTTTSAAIFANADWRLSDKLTFTTGLRYSDDKADYVGCTQDIDGAGVALFNQFFFGGNDSGAKENDCVTVIEFATDNQRVGAIEDTLDENSLSWRFAANYKFSPEMSIYTTYSRGFKAGSYPSLAAIVSNQLDPVVQERLDAYEIGLKTILAEGNAQLNLSAFYYDYKDKQLLTKKTIPVFRTAFTLGNMEDSMVRGVELDFQWLPTNQITLWASVGLLDSEIKQGNGFNQLGQSVDFAGSPLPFSAQLQANLSVQYQWQFNDSLQGFAVAESAFSGKYNTDFKANVAMTTQVSDFIGSPVEVNIPPQPYEYDNRFTQPSYTLFDVRVGVMNNTDKWRSYFWIKNLTNEYYKSSVVKNNEMISAYPGMTRTFGITLEYNL